VSGTVKTTGYVSRPRADEAPYRLGSCQDCGQLYAWERVACWRLRNVYAGVYCAQCGSELDLRTNEVGESQGALVADRAARDGVTPRNRQASPSKILTIA
jgi:hypothetical protein